MIHDVNPSQLGEAQWCISPISCGCEKHDWLRGPVACIALQRQEVRSSTRRTSSLTMVKRRGTDQTHCATIFCFVCFPGNDAKAHSQMKVISVKYIFDSRCQSFTARRGPMVHFADLVVARSIIGCTSRPSSASRALPRLHVQCQSNNTAYFYTYTMIVVNFKTSNILIYVILL